MGRISWIHALYASGPFLESIGSPSTLKIVTGHSEGLALETITIGDLQLRHKWSWEVCAVCRERRSV